MISTSSVLIRIQDPKNNDINKASVFIYDKAKSIFVEMKSTFDPVIGLFRIENVPYGKFLIKVESGDMRSEPIEIDVSGVYSSFEINIGSDKYPYYYRKGKKVYHVDTGLAVLDFADNTEDTNIQKNIEKLKKEEHYDGIDSESRKKLFKLKKGIKGIKKDKLRSIHPLIRLKNERYGVLDSTIEVEFVKGVDQEKVTTIAEMYGFFVSYHQKNLPNIYWLTYLNQVEPQEMQVAVGNLQANLLVYQVSNRVISDIVPSQLFPDDKLYPSQQWYMGLLGVPEAWSRLNALDVNPSDHHHSFGNADIIVTIYDSGVKTNTVSGVTSPEHPDFEGDLRGGNLSSVIGNSLKHYNTYDYSLESSSEMVSGNNTPRGSSPNHGTNVAGIILGHNSFTKTGNEGISGISPNVRLFGAVNPGLHGISNHTSIDNRYGHALSHMFGFDPLWLRSTNAYSGAQNFPGLFSTIGLIPSGNPNYNPSLSGPGTEILNQSFSAPSSVVGAIAKNSYSEGSTYGRKRKGVLVFSSSGNDDVKFTNKTALTQGVNNIIVSASTIDHRGREIKALYSSFGDIIEPGIDFCAPSGNIGMFASRSHAIATTDIKDFSGTINSDSSVILTLGANANVGSTTIETSTTISGGGAFTSIIKNLGNKNESENIYITGASGPTTLNLKFPLLKKHFAGDKIISPAASGTKFHTMNFSGTSASCPMASGVAALVLTANPKLTWMEVRQLLRSTSTPINLRLSNPVKDFKWYEFSGKVECKTGNELIDANGLLRLTGGSRVSASAPQYPANNSNYPQYFINMGNLSASGIKYKKRQAILIGAETVTTDTSSGTTIKIDSGYGEFSVGNQIRIGREAEAFVYYDIKKDVEPTSYPATIKKFHISNMDGFSLGDTILIDIPGANVTDTIASIDAIEPSSLIILTTGVAVADNSAYTALIAKINNLPIIKRLHSETATITAINIVGSNKELSIDTSSASGVQPLLYSYPVNTIVQLADTETRVIKDIITSGSDTIIEVDKFDYLHTTTVKVSGGRVADYSKVFGYGRLDAAAAVKEAINRGTNPKGADLMIRKSLTDNGDVEYTGIIQSPDIWIRNADDMKGRILDPTKDEYNQNPELSVKITDYQGTGADDLKVFETYTGTAEVEYKLTIETGGSTFSWNKIALGTILESGTAVPITSGIVQTLGTDGLQIQFGSASYTVGNSWTIKAKPVKRYIYVRVSNRGTEGTFTHADGSNTFPLYKTRLFFCLSDDAIELKDFIISGTNSYLPASGLKGTKILNVFDFQKDSEDAADVTFKPSLGIFSATQPNANSRLFKVQWNDADLPLLNSGASIVPTPSRMYLLAETVPHDGNMNEDVIGRNNNLSFREISFIDYRFREPSTGNKLSSYKIIDPDINNGSFTLDFKLDVIAQIGALTTEKVSIEIIRKPLTGSSSSIRFEHDGANFAYSGSNAGIANIQIPVIYNTTTTATGKKCAISFSGDISGDKTFQKVSIKVEVKNPEGVVLSTFVHDVLVVNPANDPSILAGIDDGSDKSKFNFFTEYGTILITQSNAAKAYGPLSNTSFNTTSLHTATTDPNAYAVADGELLVQQNTEDSDLINIILKAKTQGAVYGARVKYYVYRGIKKSSLVDASNSNLITTRTANELTELIWSINEQIYQKEGGLGTAPAPEIKAIGLDLSGTKLDSASLDEGFPSASNYKPVPVRRGMLIGQFHKDGTKDTLNPSNRIGFGFDVILDEPYDPTTFGHIRKGQNIITVPGGLGTLQNNIQRCKILNYLDPAALYGMHLYTRLFAKSTISGDFDSKKTKKSERQKKVYDEILTKFFNVNVIYLDIRNNSGFQYNFYDNYTNTIKLRFVKDTGVALTTVDYREQGWPIKIIRKNDITAHIATNEEDKNIIRLSFPTGDNSSPVAYLAVGSTHEQHPKSLKNKRRYFELTVSGGYTSELELGVPNIISTGNLTLPSAWYLKIYLLRRAKDGTLPGNTSVLTPKHYFDFVFFPEEPTKYFDNSKSMQFNSSVKEVYMDGDGTIGFAGMMTSGIAKENGRLFYYGVPNDQFLNIREGDDILYKELSTGSSEKPSFFDIVKHNLSDLKLRKRNLQLTASNQVSYLELNHDNIIGAGRMSPYNLFGIIITPSEYSTLKTSISALDQSLHPVTFNVRNTSTFKDINDNGYHKIEVGLCGLNSSGDFTELTNTVILYSSDGILASSDAAATIEGSEPVAISGDISFRDDSNNIQVYKRVKYFEGTGKDKWELYDATGNIQQYKSGEEDYYGNSIATQNIEIPCGTRVLILGRLIIPSASFQESTECYRVLCWHRGHFRDGFIHQYAFKGHSKDSRVNVSDINNVSNGIIVESFITDAEFELKILRDMFTDKGITNSNNDYQKLYQQLEASEAMLGKIKDDVKGSLSSSMIDSYAAKIISIVNNNPLALKSKNIPLQIKKYREIKSLNSLIEFQNFLVFSLEPGSKIFDIIKANISTYPIFYEGVSTDPGEVRSNGYGNMGGLVNEYLALKQNIDNMPDNATIIASEDYQFLAEVTNALNTDPSIHTIQEVVVVISLGSHTWSQSEVSKRLFLSSSVAVDQSIGYIDSNHVLSVLVNEMNVSPAIIDGAPVDLIRMLTDTHFSTGDDADTVKLWEYLRNNKTIEELLGDQEILNQVRLSSSPGFALRALFMRNVEIGIVYLSEYLNY